MTLTRITSDGITDAAIVNADINASAAIAGSKIDPSFTSNLEITANSPSISFNESDSSPDYQIKTQTGVFKIKVQGGSDRLSIAADGTVNVANNLDVGAGIDVTGNISATGTLACTDITSSDGTPSIKLNDSANNQFAFIDGNSGNLILHSDKGNTGSSSTMKFGIDNAIKMTLDASGNLDVSGGIDATGNVDLSSAESNSSNTAQFKLSNLSIGQHNNVGSYRFANAGTGSFLFSADAINFFNKDVNKNFLRLSASSVELYHDNVKKAETSSTGFDIPEDFIAGSGSKLTVGASGDLTFFHDSANSYVQNNTGDLILGDTNHQYFRGNTSDKSVSLYFNGSEKQKTTSSGVSVTGSISVSGTVDGRDLATDGSKLDGIASGATNVTNTNQLTNGAGFLTSVSQGNITNGAVGQNQLASGAVITTKLSDNNVTFAKLENIPQNRVIGRIASGSGDPTTLTPANIRSMINVEDGATADQSASEILTLIKTVDGSGSGLDADTLDGENSGAYLRSNVADQASGDITFAGGAGAVTIEANSDITFNNGSTWSGNQTKISHHGGYLYIVGGTNGIAFRESGTNRAFITGSGHFEPGANNTYDLGGSSARWRNVYTSDLVLSNEGSKNDVDGTWGSYTIQEGEESLFLINKRNGKKYKFNLTEVN